MVILAQTKSAYFHDSTWALLVCHFLLYECRREAALLLLFHMQKYLLHPPNGVMQKTKPWQNIPHRLEPGHKNFSCHLSGMTKQNSPHFRLLPYTYMFLPTSRFGQIPLSYLTAHKASFHKTCPPCVHHYFLCLQYTPYRRPPGNTAVLFHHKKM